MPYNGSGTFTPYTPGNPVITGTTISSSAFNSTMSDLAAGLTNVVTRDGQSPPTANLPMGGRKHTGLAAGTVAGDSLRWEQLFSQGIEQDIASAATTDIGGLNTTVARITGATTITSFGTNYNGPRFVRFAGILTLTHNATTLILPSGANIVTAAGDRAILTPVGNPASGWQVLAYQRADGTALVGGVQPGAITSSGLTMATARMLGRTTAATGAIEELTQAQVRTFLALAAIATSGSAADLTTGDVAVARLLAAFNASGTSAPLYACRAWVNFNGTGTVAIRGSGNVNSITDNGTGLYTMNFNTTMPDINFCAVASGARNPTSNPDAVVSAEPVSAGGVALRCSNGAGTFEDFLYVHCAVFR